MPYHQTRLYFGPFLGVSSPQAWYLQVDSSKNSSIFAFTITALRNNRFLTLRCLGLIFLQVIFLERADGIKALIVGCRATQFPHHPLSSISKQHLSLQSRASLFADILAHLDVLYHLSQIDVLSRTAISPQLLQSQIQSFYRFIGFPLALLQLILVEMGDYHLTRFAVRFSESRVIRPVVFVARLVHGRLNTVEHLHHSEGFHFHARQEHAGVLGADSDILQGFLPLQEQRYPPGLVGRPFFLYLFQKSLVLDFGNDQCLAEFIELFVFLAQQTLGDAQVAFQRLNKVLGFDDLLVREFSLRMQFLDL